MLADRNQRQAAEDRLSCQNVDYLLLESWLAWYTCFIPINTTRHHHGGNLLPIMSSVWVVCTVFTQRAK
jgi:hypothetical protein